MASAFGGVWFAFDLQNKNEEKKIHKKQIESVNRAIFLLSQYFNVLVIVKEQQIDPFRDNPLSMGAFTTIDYSDYRFDIDNLCFLLQTEDRNILSELLLIEQKFHRVLFLINQRSEFHYTEVQPKFENGTQDFSIPQMVNLRSLLGERVYHTLKQSTDDVIESIDEAIPLIVETGGKFRKAAIQEFPDGNIIGFVNDRSFPTV